MALWVKMPRGCDALAPFRRGQAMGINFMSGDVFTRSGLYQNCLRLTVGQVAENRYDDCMRRLGSLTQFRRLGR